MNEKLKTFVLRRQNAAKIVVDKLLPGVEEDLKEVKARPARVGLGAKHLSHKEMDANNRLRNNIVSKEKVVRHVKNLRDADDEDDEESKSNSFKKRK